MVVGAQGGRLAAASPLKTPGGNRLDSALGKQLAAAALRPSAQAALQSPLRPLAEPGESPQRLRFAPPTLRKDHPRKSPPERLPIGLMQYRDWLMLGCDGCAHANTVMGPAGGDAAEAAMTPVEVTLRHCLNLRARRWATYEFMTPAIDEPWYSRGSMPALLRDLGLHQARTPLSPSFVAPTGPAVRSIAHRC